jgi:hypothetical protein
MISAGLAQADTVRVITPVDANGNPTGPSRTIIIPDEPDATAVVEPVDANGNPVGPPVEIPDATVAPPPPDAAPDLVPDEGSILTTRVPRLRVLSLSTRSLSAETKPRA